MSMADPSCNELGRHTTQGIDSNLKRCFIDLCSDDEGGGSSAQAKGKRRETTRISEVITLTDSEDDGDVSIQTSSSIIREMHEKLAWYQNVGLVIDWW